MEPSTLVPVPIITGTGDAVTVQAIESDGNVWVAAKRICETLGLAWQSQHAKLTDPDNAWAVITEIVTTAPDGKNYSMSMVSLDALPMWLATIKAGKVAPAARPALVAYQCEAARVLRDHFMPGQSTNHRGQGTPDFAALHDRVKLLKELRGVVPDVKLAAAGDRVLAEMGLAPGGGDPVPPATEKGQEVPRFAAESSLGRRILQIVEDAKGRQVSMNTLRQGIHSRHRPRFSGVLDELVEDGLLAERKGPRGGRAFVLSR